MPFIDAKLNSLGLFVWKFFPEAGHETRKVVRRHIIIQGVFRKVKGRGWKTGMKIIQWAAKESVVTEELMVAGQELQQGHSTWSRESKNKTSPGAQQPLNTGEAILQWGKSCLWIPKGGLRTFLLCQTKPCVRYVSRVMLSLQLQAV